MKYVLILWVCSFVNNNGCLPPMEAPKLYNSWYECSVAAQQESISILQKMGYADVNKYQLGTKYLSKKTKTL